jgi:hypothetical protein
METIGLPSPSLLTYVFALKGYPFPGTGLKEQAHRPPRGVLRTDAGHPSSSHTPLFQGILSKRLFMEGSSGPGSEEPNREKLSHRRSFGNLPRKDQSDRLGGDAQKEVPKNRQ